MVVGQTLGEGDPEGARFSGLAITALGLLTLGIAGGVLFFGAESIARVFTNDAETLNYAIDFTRVFGISMLSFGVFSPIAGSLRGAGDTQTPFFARLTGTLAFTLGFAYLFGIVLDYGLLGVYAGLALTYAWWALVVAAGFRWGDWADKAAEMMAERAEASD